MRRYLIAGLLVWVPLGITVFVIKLLVDLMDRSLLLLPPAWRPDALLGFHIPGLGLLLSLIVLFVTGILAANILGRQLVGAWESLLARIPLVRSIYSAVKQVLHGLLSTGSESFRKVLLIQYPRTGIWTLCFQTATSPQELQDKTSREVVTVFVPTTPNPTSGFIMVVPKDDTIELDMDVEEGLKMIMSLGVVSPGSGNGNDVAPIDPNP